MKKKKSSSNHLLLANKIIGQMNMEKMGCVTGSVRTPCSEFLIKKIVSSKTSNEALAWSEALRNVEIAEAIRLK